MNNQSEKPIEELLRGIPQDHRICIPFQWAEDGRETGHHYIPVGRHAHRAVDEIAALREQLAASRQEVEVHKAMADKHYELGTEYFDLYTKAVRGQLKERTNDK
jgi:predicted ribonuclease YlaK